MKECETPGCTSTELIYSGVDAVMRGLPFTERFCYTCANAYHTISKEIAALPIPTN